MHNTGRALATQWDALLGYYCQARGWHWKTADAVGRMPAGHLVSSQLRGFSGEQSAFPPSTDPSLLQPYRWPLCLCNLRSMPGQVFWATTTKKKKKPQANRQSTSGTSLSKGKGASQGKQFVFPSKLASCSNTRGQQWALSESLKSQFYGGWVMARRIMPREAYQLCFYVVYNR